MPRNGRETLKCLARSWLAASVPAVQLRPVNCSTRLGSRRDDVRTRVRQAVIRPALDFNSLRSSAFRRYFS